MLPSSIGRFVRSGALPALCIVGLGTLAQAQTSAYVCKDDGRHWLHRNITAAPQTLTLAPFTGSDKTFNVVVRDSAGIVATYMFSPGVTPPVPLLPGQRAVIVDVPDGNSDPAFGLMTIS
jgi:hypothetical protein